MKNFAWVTLVMVGIGIMALTAFVWQKHRELTPWTYGFLFASTTNEDISNATELDRPYVRSIIRLEPEAQVKPLLEVIKLGGPQSAKTIEFRLKQKVILFPSMEQHIKKEYLAWGRLPISGANEIICGSQIGNETLPLGSERYEIVGGLRPEVTLFQKCYLLPFHQRYEATRLFEPNGDDVRIAYLFPSLEKPKWDLITKDLPQSFFPRDRFHLYTESMRVSRASYYFLLLGIILFLIGSTLLMTKFYLYLAAKVRNRVLAPPLNEIAHRRNLFLIMHLIYFGLMIVGMAMIYQIPLIQECIITLLKGEVESGQGILGTAGKAYATGNIFYAALVTVLINYLWATLATITLPSIIIPSIGVLVSICRAAVLGICFAPAFSEISSNIAVSSIVVFLECEGYIVASFFALLLFLYLIRGRVKGEPIWSRYVRGLLINGKAAILVFVILLIAAFCEAIAVIIIL